MNLEQFGLKELSNQEMLVLEGGFWKEAGYYTGLVVGAFTNALEEAYSILK
jgi:hypothetical protein